MLWRTVVFWVGMALRVLLWGGMVVGGLWVWNRGLEGAAEDVRYWTGYWRGEYEGYAQQARLAGRGYEAYGRWR